MAVVGACVTRDAAESASGASVASTTVPPSEVVASAAPVAPTLVLDRDGLGVASFGDVADDTIAAVTAVLGEPDKDSGWVEPLTIGACGCRGLSCGARCTYFSDESGVGHGERHSSATRMERA